MALQLSQNLLQGKEKKTKMTWVRTGHTMQQLDNRMK